MALNGGANGVTLTNAGYYQCTLSVIAVAPGSSGTPAATGIIVGFRMQNNTGPTNISFYTLTTNVQSGTTTIYGVTETVVVAAAAGDTISVQIGGGTLLASTTVNPSFVLSIIRVA